MSHINKQAVTGGLSNVAPDVLKAIIPVAAQVLGLQKIPVTSHIFDWSGNQVTEWGDLKLICGIESLGSASSGVFAGMGLAIDKEGKLQIVGDFYTHDQKKRQKELERLFEGAAIIAARILMAQAKGQKFELSVNQEGQPQLVLHY